MWLIEFEDSCKHATSSNKDSRQSKLEKLEDEEYKKKLNEESSNMLSKFRSHKKYIRNTTEFVKKVGNEHKKKKVQHVSSFITTIYNLYSQHVGKLYDNNSKEIEDEKSKYFNYLIDFLLDKELISWQIFEYFKEKDITNPLKMIDWATIK